VAVEMSDPRQSESGDVTAYLKRLVATIFVGIVLMTLTAVWAWHRYGRALETAAPLPEGPPKLLPVTQ
jgi:hypothetical protein